MVDCDVVVVVVVVVCVVCCCVKLRGVVILIRRRRRRRRKITKQEIQVKMTVLLVGGEGVLAPQQQGNRSEYVEAVR